MSKCTHCLQGLCRRHPLLDHGERERLLKKKAEDASRINVHALLQAQIDKLSGNTREMDEADMMDHRQRLDLDRASMQIRESKSNKKRTNEYLSSTGLNASVASLMVNHSEDERSDSSGSEDSASVDTASDSDEDSDSDDSRRSSKRRRKEKEKKKKSSKESRKSSSSSSSRKHHKKDKKERHKDRKREKVDRSRKDRKERKKSDRRRRHSDSDSQSTSSGDYSRR